MVSGPKPSRLGEAIRALDEHVDEPLYRAPPPATGLWIVMYHREVPDLMRKLGPSWRVLSFEEVRAEKWRGETYDRIVFQDTYHIQTEAGHRAYNQAVYNVSSRLRVGCEDNLIFT